MLMIVMIEMNAFSKDTRKAFYGVRPPAAMPNSQPPGISPWRNPP
jgi:hypothetical protein